MFSELRPTSDAADAATMLPDARPTVTYDCWKAVVGDVSSTPTAAADAPLVVDVLAHANVTSWECASDDSLIVRNVFRETYRIERVSIPGGGVAAHARCVQRAAALIA